MIYQEFVRKVVINILKFRKLHFPRASLGFAAFRTQWGKKGLKGE